MKQPPLCLLLTLFGYWTVLWPFRSKENLAAAGARGIRQQAAITQNSHYSMHLPFLHGIYESVDKAFNIKSFLYSSTVVEHCLPRTFRPVRTQQELQYQVRILVKDLQPVPVLLPCSFCFCLECCSLKFANRPCYRSSSLGHRNSNGKLLQPFPQ